MGEHMTWHRADFSKLLQELGSGGGGGENNLSPCILAAAA